ncbi:MAG: ABC transporter permease [Spirochaetales bacterium]|nr:ABC transporter permease [Spirochaetales bacterium]
MKYIKMAIRNISREKKRSFLPAAAIAFGLFIVTLVSMLSFGVVESMSKNITKMLDGHIIISGEQKLESGKIISNMADKDEILKIINESGIPVTKINKRSEVRVELIFSDNNSMSSFSGMNWEIEDEVKKGFNFVEGGLENINEKDAILITDKMAEELDVKLGDYVIGKLNSVTGQTNVADFKVVGILKSSSFFASNTGYANISYLNSLLSLKADDFQSIILTVDDIEKVDKYGETLYSLLKDEFQLKDKDAEGTKPRMMSLAFSTKEPEWFGDRYTLTTITEMTSFTDIFLQVIDAISLVVLGILFLVIIVGIANTFRMIMYDRVKEIGSMRAMGMQKSGVRTIFLFEGMFLALFGSISGVILAGIVAFGLTFINFGTESFIALLLNNGHLLFIPSFLIILRNVAAVTILTVLVVLFPANKAAKLDPAKAIASMY